MGGHLMGIWIGASVGRLNGGLARLIGRSDECALHYEEAIDFLKVGGFKPELAFTYFDFSRLLLDRDAPGDREKATEHQDEAIAIAQELGMKPLLERVLAQREILKA